MDDVKKPDTCYLCGGSRLPGIVILDPRPGERSWMCQDCWDGLRRQITEVPEADKWKM